MKVRVSTTTRKQKKEALRELMPFVTQYVESIMLWELHEQCGFGAKRLKRFFDATNLRMNEILDEYCWDKNEDAIWFCKYKLKDELGIDIENVRNPFSVKTNLK